MNIDFLIRVLLGVIGTALIASGIVIIVRGKSTKNKAWGAAAVAAGVVLWAVILFTTIVSSTTST